MSQNPRSKLSNTGVDFTPTIHNDTYPYITPAQFNLQNRSVLITGASKGIGRKSALSFAKAGASQIAIAARSDLEAVEAEILATAKEAGRPAPEVLCLKLDVADEKGVAEAAEAIEGRFGELDIVVNNAGYLEKFVPIAESDPKDWWRVWEVNVKGPYLLTRAMLPLMLQSKNNLRTILNVSSIGANAARPGASGYQTGKLAVIRFSEFINAEYGDQGVLSFAIHPGGVPTELALGMPDAMHSVLIDQPELAADSIVWLTAEKRQWLAGRYVSVTWDMKELLEKRAKIEEEDLLKVRLDVGVD